MSAQTGMGETIQSIVDAQGWNEDSVMDLALTYIARQQDDEAFADFLRAVADEENAGSDDFNDLSGDDDPHDDDGNRRTPEWKEN